MKHTFARLAGLLLAVCLVLSGCNLIAIDPVMQLDEDIAALKEDYAAVVANYNGGTITKGDAMPNFMYMYSYYSSMYSYMGMGIDEEMIESLKQEAILATAQNRAIEAEFDRRGLTLTEEKQAEIAEELETIYQDAYDYYVENAAGDTEEVRVKQAEYDMYRDGYLKDQLEKELVSAAKYDAVDAALRAEIAEVSDEELEAAYEEQVSADEDMYSGDPASFESMMADGGMVAWIPEGYRTVKHILVIPEDDVLNAVADARNAYADAEDMLADLEEELANANDDDAEDTDEAVRPVEEIQAEIEATTAELPALKAAATAAEEACLASIQDKLDEIYGKLEAGEAFDAVMAEYGEDPGMQNEPTMSTGYYVCANSGAWDENFTKGAMLLENVGDVSETPAISTSGVHIIRYESDVESGAVALEEIRDQLYEQTMANLQEAHITTMMNEWLEDMNVQYNIANFNVDSMI